MMNVKVSHADFNVFLFGKLMINSMFSRILYCTFRSDIFICQPYIGTTLLGSKLLYSIVHTIFLNEEFLRELAMDF